MDYFHKGIFVILRAYLVRKYGSRNTAFFLYFSAPRGAVVSYSVSSRLVSMLKNIYLSTSWSRYLGRKFFSLLFVEGMEKNCIRLLNCTQWLIFYEKRK